MSDWANAGPFPCRATIGPFSPESLGIELIKTTPVSGAYPTANKAIFIPFRLSRAVTFTTMMLMVGATNTGNVDVGIYSVNGTLLVSSGSTACGSTSAAQTFNITDITIGPGTFYLALAASATTLALHRWSHGTVRSALSGILEMATAFPLPATATMVTTTLTYIPMFCASRIVTV